jgi:hypothetical protein
MNEEFKEENKTPDVKPIELILKSQTQNKLQKQKKVLADNAKPDASE